MSGTEQKPRKGCLASLFQGLCIVAGAWILIVFFVYLASTDVERARPTTAPIVTAVPTSTAAPDDCVSWATYYAKHRMPDDMTLSEVQISTLGSDKYLSIACDMDVMWKSETYIRSGAEFICDMIPLLRDRQGFDHITFLFYGPFIDKYGNEVQSLGMRAMYSRATLQKINTKYFDDHLYSDPEGIFEAADTHMIHTLYKD